MKLYHATSRPYDGEALRSLLRQVEAGELSEAAAVAVAGRWDAGDAYLVQDGAMVSLTADLEEAKAIRQDWNGGQGVILAVDGDALLEDGLLRKNAEGYPAVLGRIEAVYIIGEVA